MAKKGTEIVLNAFTGICCVCKEKGHKATHCTNKEAKGGNKNGKGGNKSEKTNEFNAIATTVESKAIGIWTAGSCRKMQLRGL